MRTWLLLLLVRFVITMSLNASDMDNEGILGELEDVVHITPALGSRQVDDEDENSNNHWLVHNILENVFNRNV